LAAAAADTAFALALAAGIGVPLVQAATGAIISHRLMLAIGGREPRVSSRDERPPRNPGGPTMLQLGLNSRLIMA